MPGVTDQGRSIRAAPDDAAQAPWTTGSVLPLATRADPTSGGLQLKLAVPTSLQDLGEGLIQLLYAQDRNELGMISDSGDPLYNATGGRLNQSAELPLVSWGLKDLGARGDPNELSMFGGVHAKQGPELPEDWFTGAEGSPKFEINDYPAKLYIPNHLTERARLGIPDEAVPMEQILDHPELYQRYPELRQLPVRIKDLGPNTWGTVAKNGDVVLNPLRTGSEQEFNGITSPGVQRSATQDELMDVLLHEVQHKVQSFEGFAEGTNPQGGIQRQLAWAKDRLTQQALMAKSPDEFTARAKEVGQINKLLQSDPGKLYWDTAGEVEARNVSERRNIQREIAQQYPAHGYDEEFQHEPLSRYEGYSPEETELVPRSRQLVVASRPYDKAEYTAVDHDPFTQAMIPVDHDPWAEYNTEAYHGSLTNDIGSFHPESHFGTAAAANKRVMDLLDLQNENTLGPEHARGEGAAATVYPVRMRITKAFEMPEDANDITDIAMSMYQQKLLSNKELEQVQEGTLNPIDKLKEHGYNSIKYKNAWEDPGSDSWIVFDPKDVIMKHAPEGKSK